VGLAVTVSPASTTVAPALTTWVVVPAEAVTVAVSNSPKPSAFTANCAAVAPPPGRDVARIGVAHGARAFVGRNAHEERGLGLVVVPTSTGGRAGLKIADVREEAEVWPIGWPRAASPVDLSPRLYESTEIEVADVPLTAVMAAVTARAGVPVLVDRNALAAAGIDPATAKVRFPLRKASYMRLLEATAAQAGVGVELRQDDGGRPFLWLSSK